MLTVNFTPRNLRIMMAELEMAVTEHHDESRRDEIRAVLEQIREQVPDVENAVDDDEQCDATDSAGVRCEMKSAQEHEHAAPEALKRFLSGNRT
jgi:hypothetical protein